MTGGNTAGNDEEEETVHQDLVQNASDLAERPPPKVYIQRYVFVNILKPRRQSVGSPLRFRQDKESLFIRTLVAKSIFVWSHPYCHSTYNT
jgi:hypothetical protein